MFSMFTLNFLIIPQFILVIEVPVVAEYCLCVRVCVCLCIDIKICNRSTNTFHNHFSRERKQQSLWHQIAFHCIVFTFRCSFLFSCVDPIKTIEHHSIQFSITFTIHLCVCVVYVFEPISTLSAAINYFYISPRIVASISRWGFLFFYVCVCRAR